VIIGWDETARAPQQWLKQHTVSQKSTIHILTLLDRNMQHDPIIQYYLIQEINVLIKHIYLKNILKLLLILKSVFDSFCMIIVFFS
jgi:hypothetical protein